MNQKKQSSISRMLDYAEGHKVLTILGCALSGIAAVLGLIPYVCVWLTARVVLEVFPDVTKASGLEKWGWAAVIFAVANILF